MAVDVTSLSISVASSGIKEAATALEALSKAAANVEAKTKTIKEATSGLSSSQQASVANIEKLIAGFQKQADLVGANVSQINAYTTAMKGGTKLEQEMAMMLGAEVDAYRAKAVAQQKAIADNKALDASYAKLAQEADKFYASQAKAQAAGNALNQAGQREQELKKIAAAQKELTRQTNELAAADARQKSIQQSRDIEMRAMSYTKLAAAQAEALAMNRALDAEQNRIKTIQQARDVELHAMSYQRLAAAQAEAIKMNNAYDASIRKLALDEAVRKQAMFNGTMQQGHDIARGLSGSLGALWLTYGSIGSMLLGVAIGASLKEAITGFTAVEYQMTMVKALTEDTTQSVKELTHQMHEVALNLGIAPEAAAKGLRALAQAGLDTKSALETLPVAFKLATVGELALEQAALAATGVMNAYGLKVRDLEHIGDTMAKAGAMSAASVDSISVSMKYSAGTAEQYGVSLEKLGTILTLLGKRGITGSSAGVAANNLIAEIYSPSSDKAIRAMAALGVHAYADGVRKEFEVVAAEMKDALTKFDAESQGKLLEDMFGKKGGKGFYAIAKAGQEDFLRIEKELVGATGFTAEVYRQSLQTIQGQMNLTKAAITNMFAQVGEESSAPIKALLNVVRDIASTDGVKDAFTGLSQSIKTFITTVIPAASAVGALWLAMKVGPPVITAVTAAMTLFSSAGFAAAYGRVGAAVTGLIGAFQAGSLAMLAANPIVVGLVGVVTLLAGAYFLLKRDKESAMSLHSAEMKNSEETQKHLKDEITLLDRKIGLQRRGVSADAEVAELRKMANQDALTMMQNEVAANEKKIEALTKQGPGRSEGGDLARQTMIDSLNKGNAALRTALKEKEVAFGKEAELDKKRLERLKVFREEQRLLRVGEELAEQGQETPTTGTQKYGKDAKGARAAANDAFQAELQTYQNQINAAKKQAEVEKALSQSAYKQGLLGERGLIEMNYAVETALAGKTIAALQSKVDAETNAANKRALMEKHSGEIAAAKQAIEDAAGRRTSAIAELEVSNQEKIQKSLIATYLAKGEFSKAYEEEFKAKHNLDISRLQQNIDMEVDIVKKGEFEKRKAQMNDEYNAGAKQAFNKEALVAFNTEADKTRNILKGVQTASENQGLAAMFDAASAASAKYAAELPTLKAMMADITDPKGQEEAQARMTNNAENFRKMWVGVGESITHSLKAAFGSGGEAAGKLIKIAQDYNNLEVKSGSARIKSYGDAAGAAKGFFKEGTSGYMVLAAAEKAFRALELAGMLQSLVMTGTVEAGKQAFKVPTVLMEFMSQMGPWGLAAGAAAIAAIGVTGSGGGGGGIDYKERQRTQSAGSVLGNSDAKSESIANSLSILEKNSGLGLAHSTTMIRYLKNVSDNIAGLASALLVRAGVDITKGPADYVNGGFVGKISNSVFGGNKTTLDTGIATSKDSLAGVLRGSMNAVSYNQTKEDGGWFSSDKYRTEMKSLGTDTNAQFTKVISNMADSIKAAAKDLGVGGDAFTAHLNTFIVDIGSISAKGLTGTEVQKALEEAFSKLGDDMAKFAIVGLDKFQKVGEGYLETVMRVANDLVQVTDVFKVLGKTFNLTGIAAVNVSESLITAVGGLDRLGEGAKFFVDNFLTEAEKMGPITASVTNEMARLGYGSINTVEGFSKLVRSLDLTDPASQRLYGSLMDIAPQFLEAANYATKLADGTVELTKAQQKALDGINKAKSQLQDSYNSESSALQGTIDKTKTFITTLKNYQDSLKLGADSPLTNMQKYAEARKQFDATALAANGGDQAAKDRFTSASSALLAASKVINASGDAYTSDFNMVQSAIDTLMGSAGTQVDVAQASLNALNASVQGLIDINKSVMSVTDAIKALQSAITLGSAAGLVSNDGGTTYVPTPAQVAAATPSTTTMPAPVSGFVTVVQNLQTSVDALREEQKAQTGALVKATYESNEANAEDTVGGLAGIIGKVTKAAVQQITLV